MFHLKFKKNFSYHICNIQKTCLLTVSGLFVESCSGSWLFSIHGLLLKVKFSFKIFFYYLQFSVSSVFLSPVYLIRVSLSLVLETFSFHAWSSSLVCRCSRWHSTRRVDGTLRVA